MSFKGEIENNFQKNPNFHSRCFPIVIWSQKIEAICFLNGFHNKSAQTDCSKEKLVPILKGLKYLNTVICRLNLLIFFYSHSVSNLNKHTCSCLFSEIQLKDLLKGWRHDHGPSNSGGHGKKVRKGCIKF